MLRNVHIWITPYIKQRLRYLFNRNTVPVSHIFLCLADHFEPLFGDVDSDIGEKRILRWIEHYEQVAPDFTDSDGRHPCHTYFFPLEQYSDRFGDLLREHCGRGFGEVEFHLHHNNDSPENFLATIEKFKSIFHRDGFLGVDQKKNIRYGFVHGNWALDNSRPDGAWCGLNNELTLLHQSGCYADFTLPSAPEPTQTRTINSIYYAVDDPLRAKSHDRGIAVTVGGIAPKDREYLIIVQGPLGVDWKWRRWGIIPRIENSDISSGHPPLIHRWKLWTSASVSVIGRPEWIFIKLHLHGCNPKTYKMLFEEGAFQCMQESFKRFCSDECNAECHYVSSREMYNIIKAAEAGLAGNPGDYRDYVIPPPPLEKV